MISIEELYKLYLSHPRISKDTRQDVSGCIYFALKGDQFDGNDFAEKALHKGAAFAIVDDPSRIPVDDNRFIYVEDALLTLQQLAAYHRQVLDVPVLAITGSNGKTTTKELLSLVLGEKYKLFSTRGNYNNHIGIPLSLLQVEGNTEFIVLEMGASAQGEISAYCEIARPDYGLITNIGKAHLEGFGGHEGVKKGKGELFDYLSTHNGLAFVNLDESHLEEVSEKVEKRFFYKQSVQLQNTKDLFTAELISSSPDIRVRFCNRKGTDYEVHSALMGKHNFNNILSALAVGSYFNVAEADMVRAIESYKPTNNRSQIVVRNSVKYILDAYNANPSSMESIIRTFANWEDEKKGLILGDMLELGDYSLQAHQAIIDLVASEEGIDFVYLVGREFNKAFIPASFQWFESINALREQWSEDKFSNYTILIKGSRSMGLEKLLE